MVAMLVQGERRAHGQASPQCTKDPRWAKGWDVSTREVQDE